MMSLRMQTDVWLLAFPSLDNQEVCVQGDTVAVISKGIYRGVRKCLRQLTLSPVLHGAPVSLTSLSNTAFVSEQKLSSQVCGDCAVDLPLPSDWWSRASLCACCPFLSPFFFFFFEDISVQVFCPF